MTALKKKFFHHRLALVLAILAAIIVAFPQAYFRFDHRDDGVYQGIELLPDSPWSPRVREAQDGHPNFGNIYQKDGKDNPYLFQPLGSIVVAYTGEVFGLDINNTLLLARILYTFVVFLVIYSFVFLLSREKWLALSAASLLLLGDDILSFSGIKQMLHGMSPDSFLRIMRPVNPTMIYIFFFGFLAAFWQFYQAEDKRDKWRYGTLSALLLGANFYHYFYTWTYLYAFGGILALIHILKRDWQGFMKVASVFAGAVILAIPFLLNLYHASMFPAYEDVGMRHGIIFTHHLLWVGSSVVVALIVFIFLFPREEKKKYVFGLALLLAPFVTMNQQLITGKVMQADHYHWFFHKPIGIIFVLMTAFYLLARHGWGKYRQYLAGLIILVSVASALFVQYYSYYYDTGDGGQVAIERQKYGPVMDWLNENAKKEAVVFANNEVSNLVTIYTPLNVFYHRGVCCTTLSATKSRLLEMLFMYYRLREISATSAETAFEKERDIVSEQIYGIYYRKLYGRYEAMPDDKFDEIVSLYKETLKTPTNKWIKDTFDKYEVEYLVWDKKDDPLWNPSRYKFLEKVADFGELVIYHKI